MKSICNTFAGAAVLLALVPSAAAEAQSACSNAVTVSRGDTLSAISSRCGVSVEDLMEANSIDNPRALQVGATLTIPDPDWDNVSGYVTGPGDTLGSIARELGLPASSLLELNPDIDPRELPAGLVLRVPSDWASSFDVGDSQ
jgi:LysM repeat protein